MKERLQNIQQKAQSRSEEKRKAEEQAQTLSSEEGKAVSELKRQLYELVESQELRNAQERFPLLLQIRAEQGETEAAVFWIDFDHTEGSFMRSDTFHPEEPSKLKGAARKFFDWLISEGFQPKIKGTRQEYFDHSPPTSTGLYISVSWNE